VTQAAQRSRSGGPIARRIAPDEYARLDLRAHALLGDVPVHDVWALDLAGGGPGRTIADVRRLLAGERFLRANAAVRFLFALRGWLGRKLGWDRERPEQARESYLDRLSAADREQSRVAPGTPEGPFRTLFVSDRESIAEVRNATVHAFSVMALEEAAFGHRLYWAVHVRPVGAITSVYMRLIDPFRRLIVYPALLGFVRRAWRQEVAGTGPEGREG